MKKPNTSTITKVTLATTTILLALVVVKLNTPPKTQVLNEAPETHTEIIEDYQAGGFSGDATIVFAATSNDTKEFNIDSGDLTFSTEEDAHKFASRYGNALMKAKSISGYNYHIVPTI